MDLTHTLTDTQGMPVRMRIHISPGYAFLNFDEYNLSLSWKDILRSMRKARKEQRMAQWQYNKEEM